MLECALVLRMMYPRGVCSRYNLTTLVDRRHIATPSTPWWSYRGDRRALFRASVGWTAWIESLPGCRLQLPLLVLLTLGAWPIHAVRA